MEQNRMNEFIHNTLVSSTQMAYVEEAHGTLLLLENLNEVFRYHNSSPQLVTLFEELDVFRRYIAIQKFRYGDRFHIRYRNEKHYKSVYIPHLAVIDLVDAFLCTAMEDTGTPVDFILEFHLEGQRVGLHVTVDANGHRSDYDKELT
jgi:two-component system, sensor histidine kinase YesM